MAAVVGLVRFAALLLLLVVGASHARTPAETRVFVPAKSEVDCTDQDGVHLAGPCRLRQPESISDVRDQAKLGQAVRRAGESLRIVYRGDAHQVLLGGGFVFALSRIPETDLWVLRLRVPELDRLVLSFRFLLDGQRPSLEVEPERWRGPKAPVALPVSTTLRGVLSELTITSATLGAERRITLYEPPAIGDQSLAAIVYVADGKHLRFYIETLEPLMTSGQLPRMVLVGVHAADGRLRGREYVRALGAASGDFSAHQHFLLDEVMPKVEARYQPTTVPLRRLLFGVSNGADWALETGLRNSETFGGIIAFSAGWPIDEGLLADTAGSDISVALASGTLEPEFHSQTIALAQQLAAHRIQCWRRELVAGHEMDMWAQLLPDALAWSLQQRGELQQ